MIDFSAWTTLMAVVFVAVGVTVAVAIVAKGFKGGVEKAGRMAMVVILGGIVFAFVVGGVWKTFGTEFTNAFLK